MFLLIFLTENGNYFKKLLIGIVVPLTNNFLILIVLSDCRFIMLCSCFASPPLTLPGMAFTLTRMYVQ